MAVVIPYVPNTTWQDGVGQTYTAAKGNTQEDGIRDAHYMPAVRAFHNANQSVNSGVDTAVALNSERYDQAGNAASTMHDNATTNSRLTCRYAGVYSISGHAEWASSGGGIRRIKIRLNGVTIIAVGSSVDAPTDSLGPTNV